MVLADQVYVSLLSTLVHATFDYMGQVCLRDHGMVYSYGSDSTNIGICMFFT